MKDSEILERLIYRAYVAPGTGSPMEAAALLPFVAAMRLYAKCCAAEEIEKKELIAAAFGNVCNGDACAVEYPEPEPVSEPDAPPEPEPKPPDEARTPAAFIGYGSGEKREIYAELMAFIAAHGLGARRKIAEASVGALTLSDVQNMTDCAPVPLAKWRVARAAMEQIANDGEKSI